MDSSKIAKQQQAGVYTGIPEISTFLFVSGFFFKVLTFWFIRSHVWCCQCNQCLYSRFRHGAARFLKWRSQSIHPNKLKVDPQNDDLNMDSFYIFYVSINIVYCSFSRVYRWCRFKWTWSTPGWNVTLCPYWVSFISYHGSRNPCVC